MKRLMLVVVIALGLFVAHAVMPAPSAQGGGTGGLNWKDEVKQSCSRLVVNATWVRKHPYQGRMAKLGRTTKACRLALTHIPG